MDKRESNYEIMKRQMQAKFASFDLSEVAKEWELEREDGYLLTTLVGRQYKIDRFTGAVSYEQNGILKEADYNVSMTLFDILTRKRQYAAGEVLPVSSFSALHSATLPFDNLFRGMAQYFDHRDAELSAACERLGGVPFGKGDVAYLLPVFGNLQVAVQFWDSDEEFGPLLNLFCDGNILNFMHYETMMLMLNHVVERLREIISKTYEND